MEWCIRVMSRFRRVWIRSAARLRMRRSGLGRLRDEVITCEYEDVHVLWEILRKTMTDKKKKRKHVWRSLYQWAGRGEGALICCTV